MVVLGSQRKRTRGKERRGDQSMTDYYKVLGIGKNATESEVKSAFRKLALKFHPDRHATSSEHSQDAANKRFRELVEAYEVLSDEKKRRLYNKGGRAGFQYGGTHEAYRRAGGDAARGAYAQGPYYQGGFHPGRSKTSPFNLRWNFSVLGFGRADYVFHALIFTMAVIGFTTAGSAADSLWKMQNRGRSFEETIEAVERRKEEQRTTDGKQSSPTTPNKEDQLPGRT